ncbi:MAG: hypothetical protein ACQEQV_07615 [Fibrobacterota bacterium]
MGDTLSLTKNSHLHGAAGLLHLRSGEQPDRVLPLWQGSGTINKGPFTLSAYGATQLMALLIPYDTGAVLTADTSQYREEHYGDLYLQTGADVSFRKDPLTLRAGWSRADNFDRSSIGKYWPGNIAPYTSPKDVFTTGISVNLTENALFTGDIYLSDEKPRFKTVNTLRFQHESPVSPAHLYIDLTGTYWSRRHRKEVYGTDSWSKEVIDLAAKFSREIKTFRFYLKANNLLNRNHAYVPGYFMPGVNFTWGFSWSIKG